MNVWYDTQESNLEWKKYNLYGFYIMYDFPLFYEIVFVLYKAIADMFGYIL